MVAKRLRQNDRRCWSPPKLARNNGRGSAKETAGSSWMLESPRETKMRSSGAARTHLWHLARVARIMRR
eukprot:2958389-Pyramimonas_sp.AAC.1